MLAATLTGRVDLFAWLLLACLVSDVLDGMIARSLKVTSVLGASLDSVADVATMINALLGIFVFQQRFVSEHHLGMIAVAGVYFAEVLASLWRYGRLSSFHTVLGRLAAFVGGLFIMALFLLSFQAWLYRLTVSFYMVALAEEFLLLSLLPQSRADVRGVYWVLGQRTAREPMQASPPSTWAAFRIPDGFRRRL